MPPRNKIPSGKVQINPLISVELYNMLREVALSQYENYRGAISAIVEEALRLYFSQRLPPSGGAHTHKAQTGVLQGEIKIKQKFNDVLTAYRRIKNYSENDIICEISESDLVRAISLAIGSDERTIRSWVKKFLDNNLLRKISEKTYIPASSISVCVEEDKQ